MPSGISISVDDARVRQMLSEAPSKVSDGLRRLIEGAAIDLQREERIRAPIAVTGRLRGSIKYSFDQGTLSAVVSPDADYAEDVEQGTRPHWVDASVGSSLYQWAKQKGINPYAVRRSIGIRGTKPHPFVKPTFDYLLPKLTNDFSAGVSEIVRSIQGA